MFADLCIKHFGEGKVETNYSIFDGYDADVVIPSLKIAIEWNGKWHYEKLKGKHDLNSVKNRDKLKKKHNNQKV